MIYSSVREFVDAGGLIAQLHTAAGTAQRLLQIRKGLQIPATEDCGDFLHPVIDQTQQTIAVKVADGRRQRVKTFLDSVAGDPGNHRLRCSVQCTDAPAALPGLPQMQLERDEDGLLYFTMFPEEGGSL